MVLFALIFSLFGLAMWVAAGVLLHFRRRQLRKTGLMRRVETSNAADLGGLPPGTPVEVKGTLRCEEPLVSEMSGQECAYYRSEVIREYHESDLGDDDIGPDRRSETVASNERFAPFAVEDGSGAVGVRGEGAEVDALEVMNRFERNTQGGITIGGVAVNLGGGARTIGYRYVESVLRLDEPVYVLGALQEDGHVGAPAEGGGDKRFLISCRSEEQLEKRYRRGALILGLLAVGLFLFGAVFVLIGAVAGVAVVAGAV